MRSLLLRRDVPYDPGNCRKRAASDAFEWRAFRRGRPHTLGVGIAGQCAPGTVNRDYTRPAMEIEPFLMERMQSVWENRVPHNLSESGVHPMTVAELLEAAGESGDKGAAAALLATR